MRKAVAIAILTLAVSGYGQFGQRGRFGGGNRMFNSGPVGGNCVVPGYRGDGTEDDSTLRKIDRSGFVYARIRYHVVPWWREAAREIPWHHDYPDGDTMFPISLDRLTTAHTSPDSYQIVDIDSPELFKYPFTYLSEPGYLDLTPADAKNLREYLDRGGFLLVDDFRGNESNNSEFQNFVMEMKKVYPEKGLVPLGPDHPIFHAFYDIDPTKMLPPYRMGNSGEPQFLAFVDDKERVNVMVDFNNDMSEYWQALDVGQCSIHEAGAAVELGVNYGIYAMTH